MVRYYRLIGKLPVPCTIEECARSLTAPHYVALTHVGPLRVSTVFLPLDHNWSDGDPLLFETMIFEDDADGAGGRYCHRYTTWDAAEKGHAEAVKYAEALVAKAKGLIE